MRVIALALLTSIVIGGAAIARGATSPANGAASTESAAQDLSGITFNLAAPAFGKVERLPEATQLRDLSAEAGTKPVATAEPRPAPKSAGRLPAKPSLKLAKQSPATPAPRPKPRTVAASIPALSPDGKPISAWRRAYILKHGHQPPD